MIVKNVEYIGFSFLLKTSSDEDFYLHLYTYFLNENIEKYVNSVSIYVSNGSTFGRIYVNIGEMLFASIFNIIHDEYIVYKKNYGKLKWVCGIQLEGNKLQNYDIIIDFDILKKNKQTCGLGISRELYFEAQGDNYKESQIIVLKKDEILAYEKYLVNKWIEVNKLNVENVLKINTDEIIITVEYDKYEITYQDEKLILFNLFEFLKEISFFAKKNGINIEYIESALNYIGGEVNHDLINLLIKNKINLRLLGASSI